MNRLSTADRVKVLSCLVEGVSQRATCRITGMAKGTVARLTVELGEACQRRPICAFFCLICARPENKNHVTKP